MKIEDSKKESCCGCTACSSVCPKSAISMKIDEQGFEYPVINESLCIECGICLNVCTKISTYKYPVYNCYAAKNKDKDVVLSSSSGGIIDALCKTILRMNGVVYGAAYNEDFKLIYKKAKTEGECLAFRGSKYVQACLGSTFQDILQDLKENKKVLFIGPSCYVGGLRSYLEMKKCDMSELYTVDFICHGVPSPGVFKDYIKFINPNNNLADVVFRNKKDVSGNKLPIPWKYGKYNCSLVYKDGQREVNTAKSRIYLNLFTSNNCLRPHCYNCDFIGVEKSGDITVADYWGIDEAHSEFADENGVSAVMIHTEKGCELFEGCHNIEYIKSSMDNISRKQGMLRAASSRGSDYEKFWEDYYKKDFLYIARKYGEYSFIGRLRLSKLYYFYSKIRYGE